MADFKNFKEPPYSRIKKKPPFICSFLLQTWQSICSSAKFASKASKLADYFSQL